MKHDMTSIFINTLSIAEPSSALFNSALNNCICLMNTAIGTSMSWEFVEIIGFYLLVNTWHWVRDLWSGIELAIKLHSITASHAY